MIAEDKREVLQRAGGEEPSHRIQEVSVWLWREGGGMEPLYETAELSSNHYTESHGHFVKAEGWKRRQKQRMVREKERKKKGLRELREAWHWYSQIQLRRYKMWDNQGSFYSGVNISKTNHPWYAYQIPFADIVLCSTALWVEYHKDYMGSSCTPSYFTLYLSRFHSVSVLQSPNIIQHNGISTESLHCALDTHTHTHIFSHQMRPFSILKWEPMCLWCDGGHKDGGMECIWRIESCNLNLIIVRGVGLNPWWAHCTR